MYVCGSNIIGLLQNSVFLIKLKIEHYLVKYCMVANAEECSSKNSWSFALGVDNEWLQIITWKAID